MFNPPWFCPLLSSCFSVWRAAGKILVLLMIHNQPKKIIIKYFVLIQSSIPVRGSRWWPSTSDSSRWWGSRWSPSRKYSPFESISWLDRVCIKKILIDLKQEINRLYLLTTGSFLASIGDGFEVSLENQNVVNMCVLVIMIEILLKCNINLIKINYLFLSSSLNLEKRRNFK